MAFSGNGPVEEWMELRREEREREDGDKDGDLLKKEMTLNDILMEKWLYKRGTLYETHDMTLLE